MNTLLIQYKVSLDCYKLDDCTVSEYIIITRPFCQFGMSTGSKIERMGIVIGDASSYCQRMPCSLGF